MSFDFQPNDIKADADVLDLYFSFSVFAFTPGAAHRLVKRNSRLHQG
jgi:hypothetical protein